MLKKFVNISCECCRGWLLAWVWTIGPFYYFLSLYLACTTMSREGVESLKYAFMPVTTDTRLSVRGPFSTMPNLA